MLQFNHKRLYGSIPLLMTLLLPLVAVTYSINGSEEEPVFRFSIQPPQAIYCNPINRSLLLVCGVIRTRGKDDFVINWIHNNKKQTNITVTDYISGTMSSSQCCEYVRVVEYSGLDMPETITEIAGEYWCEVSWNSSMANNTIMSNSLVIDEDIDYTQFEDCEEIIIEDIHVAETSQDSSSCSQYIQAFVPLLSLETIAIMILVTSNIIFIILWRKKRLLSYISGNRPPVPSRSTASLPRHVPGDSKKKHTTVSTINRISETEYESVLMSLTDIRKSKKPDPEYVEPDPFNTVSKTNSTPNLSAYNKKDQGSAYVVQHSPFTKEVDGKVYAIANPRTRDERKLYQDFKY